MAICVIINPVSGGAGPEVARQRAELAASLLAAHQEEADVVVTERRGHAKELAAIATRRGARLVVAWGGDGTVNEVASSLAFGLTPLAILPSGSGNGLATDLGVSRQADRAMVESLHAEPRAIDAGELGGRLFFSIAGIGFDAHVASIFDRGASGSRGFCGYARITCRELLKYQPGTYTIGGDVQLTAHRALFVTLANATQFGNGAQVAPSARVDDGRLNLVVFEERSRLATICALPRLFTGKASTVRGVSTERIERVTVDSDVPMTCHVDGEPFVGGKHLEARVHPAALRVCVR
jgi:YegS/Rv2252/BmrU family lipid kinase